MPASRNNNSSRSRVRVPLRYPATPRETHKTYDISAMPNRRRRNACFSSFFGTSEKSTYQSLVWYMSHSIGEIGLAKREGCRIHENWFNYVKWSGANEGTAGGLPMIAVRRGDKKPGVGTGQPRMLSRR